MNCGAQAEAKKLGATLDFQGPDQFDASLQTPIVNAVAAKNPDAMLIAPTDAKAMYAPIKQVGRPASKIVLVDTTLENADMAVSQIASDNEGGGRAAAQALAKLIGGNGKVFVVNVKPGISTTDLRAKGFEEEAKKLGLDYVGVEYNQDQPDKAAAIVKAQLAKNPDLKGIFATNLFAAEGSAGGLREAGNRAPSRSSASTRAPSRSRTSRTASCRRSSPRSPPTSAPRASSRPSPPSRARRPRRRSQTGSVILTKDNLARTRTRSTSPAAEPVVRSAGPLPRGPAASCCSDNDKRQES